MSNKNKNYKRFSFAPLGLGGKSYSRNLQRSCIAAICILVCGLFFTGCKNETSTSLPETSTREITDDLGHHVTLPAKVERAVSLAPSLTEIVFAVDSGDKLVGVTTYCNYPAEAQKIAKVGDTISPNLETIIALKPQVVFVSTASQIESFTKTLEQQNIAVFVTNPKNLDGVYQSIFQIGEIFERSDKAHEIVNGLKKRVAEIEDKTKNEKSVKVFVQFSKEPLFTIGRDSFVTDLILRAGGESVTANVAEAYPKFSKETAFAVQPEAIILSDSEDNREPNEVFNNSPAVKNEKVFRISADLLSRPSPRIVDALEQIAKSLHHEKFE